MIFSRAMASSGWMTPVSLLTCWTARRTLSSVRAELVEARSEEHTSELQSLMRISYAVFCLKKKNNIIIISQKYTTTTTNTKTQQTYNHSQLLSQQTHS